MNRRQFAAWLSAIVISLKIWDLFGHRSKQSRYEPETVTSQLPRNVIPTVDDPAYVMIWKDDSLVPGEIVGECHGGSFLFRGMASTHVFCSVYHDNELVPIFGTAEKLYNIGVRCIYGPLKPELVAEAMASKEAAFREIRSTWKRSIDTGLGLGRVITKG